MFSGLKYFKGAEQRTCLVESEDGLCGIVVAVDFDLSIVSTNQQVCHSVTGNIIVGQTQDAYRCTSTASSLQTI